MSPALAGELFTTEPEVAQSCLTLSDLMDYSLPGSSIHGIFQARVLEWGAIASGYMCFNLLPGPRAPGWGRQLHSQRETPFVPSKRLPDWASLELSPSVESCGCGLGPSPVRLG